MKHLGKIAFGALALMLTACSSDEPVAPNATDEAADDAKVYASLTLKMPSATGTRGEQIEYGQDYENNVGKITVILATKNAAGQYCYLTKGNADAQAPIKDETTNTLRYSLVFNASDLSPAAFEKDQTEGSVAGSLDENGNIIYNDGVYVFVYCNPSSGFTSRFNESIKDAGDVIDLINGTIVDGEDALIWKPNEFLMTNCEIVQANPIPDRGTLIRDHNTPENAFDLGQVRVKRVCARFDFASTNDNKYNITGTDGTTVLGTVELTDMAMFNIIKGYYFLPLVANNWNWRNPTGNPVNYNLCGDLEGYVMSFNPQNLKGSATLNTNSLNELFFYYLVGNDLKDGNNKEDNLVWTSLKNWGKDGDTHIKDYDTPWGPNTGDYRIWRYATENTIPSVNGVQGQKVGISTGVVFKAKFTPADIQKHLWDGNTVYMYNNIVYGDFATLKEYVINNKDSEVAAAFNSVNALKNGSTTDLKANLLKSVAQKDRNGFKAFEPDENGEYIMYYFYYNRHNTNGNDYNMGNNEFGVVRNNVYKLAVTTIKSYGEPEATENPDDPNEQENAYFTVSCYVMPWTVRVNDISF